MKIVGGILRKVPFRGYKHAQFFPTVQKIARKITGKSMEQIVRGEIEKESPEAKMVHSDPIMFYLNNFHLQIFDTGGYRRSFQVVPQYKEQFNTPHRKIVIETGKGSQRVYPDKSHSRVFLRQSPKEFFETVNRALKETGIDVNELKKLAISGDDRIALLHLLLPTFIKMREWGYKKRELTA